MSITESNGFFIRKFNWKSILEDAPDIAKKLKQNILTDYIMKIRSKVIIAKRKDREKLEQRRDYQNILCIDDEDVENQRNILNNNMHGDSEDEIEENDIESHFISLHESLKDAQSNL